MNTPLGVLIAVFVLIAVRRIGPVRFRIWQVMSVGALVVVLTGNISPHDAWRAINLDVMFFLLGMFVVGEGLEESGYLAHIAYRYFRRAKTRDALMLMILVAGGGASALLMNDTLAIIGTPVVLLLSRKHAMSPKLLLLVLAFAVTIGSVMSPIGNPQNLLIALSGVIQNPFVTFLQWLLFPTCVALYVTFLIVKRMFPDDFHDAELKHSQEPIKNHELAVLSRLSIRIVILLVIAKIVTAPFGLNMEFRLPHIALAAALPILVGSSRRMRILRHIDWHTLTLKRGQG